ncbi:MAG TPA: hypothetical protein VJZ00_05795 [Thermoanaerobaculia bacterium]|nr:hypothetical protein [Thermoanaerobaculia bacterium]
MRNALVLAATLLAASSALADDVEHSFQTSIPRGQVRRVVIDIPHGEFTVRNGSSTHLAVSGIASRDFDGSRERTWAQSVVNDTAVEIYVNGPEAIIRRKFGRSANSWRAQKFTGLDLRIDLPAGVDVAFETSAGEIDVDGDFGDVNVDLRAGEVHVRVPRAKVKELNASCRIGEVHTNLGRQIIDREGIFPGRTHYVNAGGHTKVDAHVTVGEVHVTLAP